MADTEFIWTAVPGGSDPEDGDVLILRIHVGIKLTTDTGEGVLGSHPQLFDEQGVSWPPTDLTIRVDIDGPGSPVTLDLTPDATTYDRAYWADVFSATTRVTDFVQRDLSGLAIHTNPASKIATAIQDLYAQAFPLGQDGLPTGSALLAAGLEDLSFRGRRGALNRARAIERLDMDLAAAGVVDTTAQSDATFDFFQLLDYYAPQDLSAFQEADGTPIPPRPPTFTFNEALVGLHAEPALQRLFGLVLQLRLSRDEHLPGFTSGVMRVRAHGISRQLEGATQRSPRTYTTYDSASGGAFAPQPRPTNPLIADGYLRMEPAAGLFSVSPVDPNEGLKLATAAGNVEVNNTLPDVTKPPGEALPALRSGLFLSQDGAAKDLKDKFDATPPSSAALDTTDLHAEDLMKGFLVDIRHDGIWRSEAFRSATYTFPTGALDVSLPDEEGHSSRGVTGHLDGNPDLYAGEVIYAWEGFPTGLPMPGRALNSDPADPQQAVDPDINPDGEPAGDLPYAISHGLPATRRFTRLLCGEEYAFRARVRWLDGSNLPPEDPDDSHATDPLTYRRTEPIPACDLYPTEAYVPGEGQGVVVLRGNYDSPPEKPFTERLVLPKRAAFPDVLKTRLFDVPDPGDPNRRVIDRTRYALLAQRDAYRLGSDPAASPMPDQPDQIMVDSAAFVTSPLPFLPDPMVTGVALHLLDGPQPGTTTAPMQGAFPDPVPLWLRLEEGSGPPTVVGDRIVVPLRKGDKIAAAHSALFAGELSSWLGVLQWAVAAGLVTQAMMDAVVAGRHTAITPWADLTFVYAVRQPLELGVIDEDHRLSRPKGATYVDIADGMIHFSRRSTDQIDVTAAWDEYVDEGPGSPAPTSAGIPPLQVQRDAAITINVEHTAGLADDTHLFGQDGAANRIEFGDTRHRQLDLGTIVTSRYAEHFTQRHLDTYVQGTTIQLPGVTQGLVPGWVTVKATMPPATPPPVNPVDRAQTLLQAQPLDPMNHDPAAPFAPEDYRPGHYRVNEALGQVELLPLEAHGLDDGLEVPANGTELRITYLVPPISRRWPDDAEGQDPLRVNVPSSARPAAPVVRYVVPTFGWATADTRTGLTSMRDGRGLRIYLERPWWTSGGGELLGVLLWAAAEGDGNPSGDMSQEHPLFPYVTQWGEDPLFDAGALPTRYPRTTDFTNRVAQSPALRVDGTQAQFPTADQLVVAVGHEVAYDPDRDLWFTDLVLDVGSAYMPFIRLALARYQPDSLGGCHLSPGVLAEFVQLAPDRSATAVVDPSDPSAVTLTLSGPGSNEQGDPDTPRGRVQVTVEERRANPELYADDEMTWTPVQPPIMLPAAPRTGPANTSTFCGVVQLPARPAAQEWRLVVEEFETHAIEPLVAGQTPGLGGRLVHTDMIVLVAGGPGGTGGGGGVPGPAPIFEEPAEEEPPLPEIEIHEVEISGLPDVGPGPLISHIQTSLGEVVVELLAVTGEGILRVAIMGPGDIQAPAGVTVHNVIDVSTTGLSHEGANLTVPAGAQPSATNSLGMRLFHGGPSGLADITTGQGPDGVTGFAATLSPFATGEYTGLRRLAGGDRIATAAAISAATFSGPVPRVYLATAGDFPDALTAGPRAAREGAPILLVGDTLPEATAEEIQRLSPPEVVVLGGEAAVGEDVVAAVRERFGGLAVRRIAGADRFRTAAAISAEAFADGADVVYVATGGSFPDALGGGAAAARDGAPMLLVTPDDVPPATAAELVRLAPTRIVVLGGTAAVSESVAARLAELTGAQVHRLAGPDRYATGAAITATFDSASTVVIATGEAFPDALAGVPAAGAAAAALVLVRREEIPEVAADQIARLSPDRIIVLGGPAAIAHERDAELASYLLRS